jgi:hypothetical protein
MDVPNIVQWLYDTNLATGIRESFWFPGIETFHVLAIVNVVGSIMIVDLRLLNIASRNRPVRELMSEVLPWTWISFIFAVGSGFLLFISRAINYYPSWPFRIKMMLLVLAGANMMFFHLITFRDVHLWDSEMKTPVAARFAGGISLVIWIAVIACGRIVGWTAS